MLTCLVIDEDAEAGEELRAGLVKARQVACLGVSVSVPAAIETFPVGGVDCLFIRITLWDDYQKIVGFLQNPPRLVVFLSGRTEKCTEFLPREVDFHLQPPYSRATLAACLDRMLSPFFKPRALQFFFLRVNCRFHAVPYGSLQSVVSKGNYLTVRTDRDEYQIVGSLANFQRRLPIGFARVGRGIMVPLPL
jgi:DNA-binding LytR/AlgR family response regulator